MLCISFASDFLISYSTCWEIPGSSTYLLKSGTGTPWYGPRIGAAGKRLSCEGRSALIQWLHSWNKGKFSLYHLCLQISRPTRIKIYAACRQKSITWTYISWKKSMCGGCRISRAESTLSCLKKQSIRSSRQTRRADTKDWNTFGNFFSATRFPSRGSVTALYFKEKNILVYHSCNKG